MLKMQLMGGALSLLTAMYAFMAPPQENATSKYADSTPFEVPDAPQFRQQAEIAGSAVEKLDQMLQMIQAGEQARLEGDQARAEVVAQVNSLAQMVKAVTQKVDENSLTKDDVVRLVSTTVNEETGRLKSEFGECDCNCQEKLAEVTKELDDLKARVKALEDAAAKVSASASTSIGPGMDPSEVAAKLKAMGYQSAAYATRTVTSSGGGGSTGSVGYTAASYSTSANTASYGGCTGSVPVPQQVCATPPVCAAPPATCVPCQQAVQTQYDDSFSTSTSNSSCVRQADGSWDCSGGGQPSAGSGPKAGGGLLSRVRARFGG